LWITKDSDTNPLVTNAPFARNYTRFILPRDVQLLYNGTVYYRSDATSSQFWNLVSTKTPSQIESTVLAPAGADTDLTNVSVVSNWIEIPFSQVFEQLSGSHMFVSGMKIENSVVNLSLKLPNTDPHTLHAVYAYNCTMMVQNGSVEYVF
jgi:hypothetical protein